MPTVNFRHLTQLILNTFVDISTRFKLTVQNYKDISTRFKLIAQNYKDIQTRYKLTVRNYKDISTRFQVSNDLYWVNDGGNWSGGHWATKSGGTPVASYVPQMIASGGPSWPDYGLTNVHFDANSFTLPGQIVNLDVGIGGIVACADMDWTGALHNPSFTNSANLWLTISGSLTTILAMTFGPNQQLYFYGITLGHTIKTNGLVIRGNVYFDADSTHQGGWGLSDDFSNWISTLETYQVDFFNGTIVSNGHGINSNYFANVFSNPGCTRTIDFTNSYLQFRYWASGDSTNLIMTLTGSTIEIGPEVYQTPGYPRNGFESDFATVYNIVKFTAAWIQVSGFSGFNPTIATLQLQPAFGTQTVAFYTGDPPNVFGINVGTVTRIGVGMITLSPDGWSPGGSFTQQWSITKTGGGAIHMDYLTVSYSTGNPDLTWYALIHSVNGGNNTRWYFETQGYKDIATRFVFYVRNYVDMATRFRLTVLNYKDISTRFKLTVRSYTDISTRFLLQVRNYKDINTRFKLTVLSYRDISTRFTLWVRNYKDINTRFKLTVQAYKDIPTRFLLRVQGYNDTATRFILVVRGYADTATRFVLTVQGFKDISTRFLLQVRGYSDVNTRFFLVVQAYRDIATRFVLIVQGYTDTTTRFLLIVQGYADTATRFRIIVQNYVDTATRFILITQSYRDTQTRYQLTVLGYMDIGTRFHLRAGGAIPIIGGDSVIGGYPVIGGRKVIR